METKMTANQMEHKRIQLGMEGVVNVARVGLGGGLALFWRSGWDVRLLSYSVGHIHVLITESNGSQFYLTVFYGHPETQQRHHSWERLRRLSYSIQGAWVVVRDFNEILLSKDKRGGRE
ncbi:unnamed protein product [Prunus armeniaca]